MRSGEWQGIEGRLEVEAGARDTWNLVKNGDVLKAAVRYNPQELIPRDIRPHVVVETGNMSDS